MGKRIRHIISTLVGALLYLFSGESPKETAQIPSSPSLVILDEYNFFSLKTGCWIVVTERFDPQILYSRRFQNDHKEIIKNPDTRIGALVVNSMQKAEIAALIGLQNPTQCIVINNGMVYGSNTIEETAIECDPPFRKIVDYFVYFWALKLKRSLESATRVDQILESLASHTFKMSVEIGKYYMFNARR